MTTKSDCAETKALLQAEIDGELDAASILRLEAHMADCADCIAERAGSVALRTAIRNTATRHAAPAELRRALAGKFGNASSADMPFVHRLKHWPSVGAGFGLGAALAASVAIFVNYGSVRDTDINGVVAAHIRALQPGHLTDVQVTDQHIVKPWFDGKVDFAPPVKDLTDQGFDLAGGRLDYIDDRNAAVIVYRRRMHLIDLFVTRGGAASPASIAVTPSGYNVERWSQNGLDYWAVSDLNRGELADFSQIWRER